ncbi:MAG: putative peptidoglycan glycosyltransferase FtsW [Chloroflexi bacterium]|nr:putative peptidoglycan glycosyltransferase FtsW [Chloroflexota bacterium]MXV92487.1 cell division protein FtsW [Chloroflexota bacterium]MXX82062.1 cell division protein FtsW [Chloroflexota bacterium]MYA92922.1 cell division protein FtsW [Chloroflexota bacterium]MYE78480.1 cell division protein FtsW [Chloroflexota bacterium]
MSEQASPDARYRRLRRRLRQRRGLPLESGATRPRRLSLPGNSILSTFDRPMLAIVLLMLTIGSLMVFSATFDWSRETHGTASGFFVEEHLRNLGGAVFLMLFFAVVDYRFWKRFAVWLLLVTIVLLVAVLFFGEEVFGARRSFTAGRFQPGELAEFAIVLYLSAWLGSRRSQPASLLYGLLPFLIVIGVIGYLIVRQPDLSSAAIVVMTAGVIYFVAGANILHLLGIAIMSGSVGFFLLQVWPYAQRRVDNFLAGWSDVTLSEYHTLQAITAFLRGGWFGVGVGQSQQKFGALPAPHTDSIFAVIGEELGVLGAAVVVALYICFAIRGFQLARRAKDDFGALLCVGFTSWVIIQALLNIAVMTGAIPSTGVPLPFISFGGSSLSVVMVGVGLMLSVQRVATRRAATSERSNELANTNRGGRHRGSYLSRAGDSPDLAARGG